MKILLCNKFFHLNGGSETVFFQERDFLIKQGYSVIDFSMEDSRNLPSPYADFFVPNINYNSPDSGLLTRLRQAVSFIHSSTAICNLKSLIDKERPHLAHLHNIYHQLTPSIIPVLKKSGIKVVLTLHDYKLICPAYLALKNGNICTDCDGKYFWKPFTENCQSSRMRGLLLSLEAIFHKFKKSYDFVDVFLAPSAFLAKLVSRRIPDNKIKVLYNGIDIENYQPYFSDKGYGLYLGRLSAEKGVKTLLTAYTQLHASFNLKVVGTGPLLDELRREYPDVEFTGYKSGQALKKLIAGAAFIVVPSEWYENCPMVILEAMAFGKPVIGSRIGGIPELIEDGKTGLLFTAKNYEELSSKMQQLIQNRELRKKMGQNARERVEREFSLKKHCTSLERIYKNLLSENSIC